MIDRLFTRPQLAMLGREYLMAGHLIDRSGMPNVLGRFGQEAMGAVAIDEWMGASPVYTRRIQQLLDFAGTDVATIFKGMQFDVGAPHGFMDFRYSVADADHGEFQLAHCGALMDVEPMGDELVHTMCHHIEDPTFDATACATNARARMRPIHRPPRVPAGRDPHCHWTVTIEHDAEPLVEPPITSWVAATLAGSVGLADLSGQRESDDGWVRYDHPLDPDLRLESFSARTLAAINDELCLQGHLLVLSFLRAVEQRFGADAALELGVQQFVGIAGVASMRLARALQTGGLADGSPSADSLEMIAQVLELHPAFRPRSYVAVEVTRAASPVDGVDSVDSVRLSLGDCLATSEPSGFSWASLLLGAAEGAGDNGAGQALDAIVQAVDPTARCQLVPPGDGARRTWEITVGHAPADELGAVTLTKFSTGADFVLH